MAAVVVLHGRLDLPAGEVERLADLLAPEERDRAARFRFARDRRRFVVRRARLRQCVAGMTGGKPEALLLDSGPFGKPGLAGGPEFSLSHSGEHWALAIGEVPLGVDIEQHDLAIDCADIAKGLFGPNERAALSALSGDRARRAFFDCWARKEAFVKAIGQGLSYPLDAFEVSVDGPARLRAGGKGWAMEALSIAADVAGAVVAHDDGGVLTLDLRDVDPMSVAA